MNAPIHVANECMRGAELRGWLTHLCGFLPRMLSGFCPDYERQATRCHELLKAPTEFR